jgi:hypothetical protein
MNFDMSGLSEPVVSIVRLQDQHPLPLTLNSGARSLPGANTIDGKPAPQLFAGAFQPEEALAGLFLLMRCWDQSHHLSQAQPSNEGNYWHAIAHRLEPDEANANYWFRQVGEHPIFPDLRDEAQKVLNELRISDWKLPPKWSPALFSRWCEQARHARDPIHEEAALRLQQIEWNLLFAWCVRRKEGN